MFSFAKTGPAKPNSCNIILRAVLKIWWWCMQNDVTTAWHCLTSFRKKQFLYLNVKTPTSLKADLSTKSKNV